MLSGIKKTIPGALGGQLKFLTDEQLWMIDEAAKEILWQTGVIIPNKEALDILSKVGCVVDVKEERVWIPPYLVDESVRKTPKSERKQRILRLFDELGLGDRVDNKPDQLSGGQQQRVAIARALALDPAIILADEPTGNLDSKTTENVMDSLKKLNREYNKTIIMVTHDAGLAHHAQRIEYLKDGVIIKSKKLR